MTYKEVLPHFYDVEELKIFLSYEKRNSWLVYCFRDNIISEIYNNLDRTSTEFNEIEEFLNSEYPSVCPKEGSFIGYKKILTKSENGKIRPAIAKLEIPEDAKRSSAFGNKCRCSKAKVLDIHLFGTDYNVAITEGFSSYRNEFKYKVGETAKVDDFDECRWNECSTGIHFFMKKEEAMSYYP